MIRTAILSDNRSGSESVQLISLIKELKLTSVSFDVENPNGKFSAAEEEVVHSSDIIYVDLPVFSAEQIKLAFRSSTHVFFRRIPSLTIDETIELINLENEAGCVTQIFHPLLFLPENLSLFQHLQIPLLMNIRLKANPVMDLDAQLRLIFLILALLDKSSLKKLDVNTLEGDNHSYVLDIRLAYSSGSIARLILSTHFRKDQSVLELFQISKPIISLPVYPPDQSLQPLSEQQAIKEFIKAVKGQPAVLLSLNEFLQARQIMQKIYEKLKLRGSSLLN
jgi:hypothetical protein